MHVITEQVGAVKVLRLNDPRRRNILSKDLCEQLCESVAAAEADEDCKAVVITGSPPTFCAGADLGDLKAASQGDEIGLHAVYQSFMDVANCRLPTFAAINGAAVGAGMNLALACDVRIAAEDVVFDTRFLSIGLHPGGGHSWMLLRAVGWSEAVRMLMLQGQVRGEQALKSGLVQRLEPAATLLEATIQCARAVESIPRELLLRTKASLRLAAGGDHQASFAHETGEQLWSLGQPAFAELLERLQLSIANR